MKLLYAIVAALVLTSASATYAVGPITSSHSSSKSHTTSRTQRHARARIKQRHKNAAWQHQKARQTSGRVVALRNSTR